MRYLPVNTENIEQINDRFAVDINDQEFIFELFWNQEGEFFSFNMYDRREEPIIVGRKIVYGIDLLANTVDERLPNVKIMAIDESGRSESKGITLENFGDSVLLGVVDNE